MRKSARKTIDLLMDFYLPCVVSGLLLAGLIALTDPAPSAGLPAAVTLLATR